MNTGADPVINTGGSITLFWRGVLCLPGGGPVSVTVAGNTWSGNTNAQCKWGITIASVLHVCFTQEVFEDSKSLCPPITFSGDWNIDDHNDCDMCCTDPEMSFELDL
jgi:hypothetical protein